MSSPLEKKLVEKIQNEVRDDLAAYTPSLAIQVSVAGRKKIDISLGKSYVYYDLASLTKILFTVPAMMRLVDQKKLKVTDAVSKYLHWWVHPKIKISQVLSHSAGLTWWEPFYKEIKKIKNPDEKREYLRQALARQKISSSKKSVYSDLDFLLLGFLLEERFEEPLLDVWGELPLHAHLKSLHFNPQNKPIHSRNLYAPTEKCPWRGQILQGEVHDDNTWSFGGVSSHAGLFGTVDDVRLFGDMLLARSKIIARAETIARFTKRAIPLSQGDWALGFMMPTKGAASCGRYFSSNSFGHTGFTGTSLWVDQKKKLVVSILSNRVHPTRDNRKFVELRPRIHDLICETVL
jgi:serine-type D-Ala-D-Ala carboxypeptidase